MQNKICTYCKTTKPLSDFWRRKDSKSGRRSECKQCSAKQKRKYYYKNHQRVKDYSYKYSIKQYGITIEDYNKMFKTQRGCCAICGRHQSNFKNRLSVDHNHNTGYIRGLLCNFCNSRLTGLFMDNKQRIESLLLYYTKALKGDQKWK